MKQLLLSLTLFFVLVQQSKAQYITIPDPDFRNELMQKYPSCFNASQQMDTTCSEILNETDYFTTSSISNWQGFQYFRNLQGVDFAGFNYVNGLPAMPATLKYFSLDGASVTGPLPTLPNGLLSLYCFSGSFGSLPALPSSIVSMEFQMCQMASNSLPALPASLVTLKIIWGMTLTSIPALPNSLQHLELVHVSDFSSLPALPASLKNLTISNNLSFASLPALPASLDTLNVNNCVLTSLPSLPASLKILNCPNNTLSTLPSLPASLLDLNCSTNNLSSLPAFPAQLRTASVTRNSITSLPALSGTSLISLSAASNQLTSIPALPATLQSLALTDNQLTSLPALPAGLLTFDCSRNQLTSLPAIPASLTDLGFNFNQVSNFPVLSSTLRNLGCGYNPFANIPVLPDSLRTFNCDSTFVTSLPTLPHFLEFLSCRYSQLNSLPSFPAYLRTIYCEGNHITCIPVLPYPVNIDYTPILTFDDQVACLPNIPGYWMLTIFTADLGNQHSATSYPLCSATNNVNHCAAFPLMTGHVFYDNNNNGVHDASEPLRANVRIQSSDGSFTFTDNNGYYQIPTSDTGLYSLSVAAAPIYFATAPLQYDFYFTSFDTLVINDFGFQATQTRDSLGISINSLNSAARPGFSYPYQIAYSNDGTTTLNANVVFNYDNTRLIYDSCSNASVINTGSSLTLSEPGFVPGMQKNFIGYFRVNPTAVIGDSLRSGAHIVSGLTSAHDSDVVAIRGSLDPNDKSATPKLTPAQVINGDYIYYTIRFQNTGTDTAFSIVVTDTLNNKLQPSTIQMIATSHPCITTVKGNAISFEFINILLPDSNVNPLKSHGYISFRIKPVNTLLVNDIVPNKAAIYFDYNSPVITNMATTTVVNPIVVPLKLLSFTVSRGTGMNANLYWQTNDEVNVKNYIIEMSTNGRTYTAAGFENAKGYQYNNYTKSIAIPSDVVLYFRLKMTDVDGRYSYSNVAILRNDKVNDAFSFLNNPVKDELDISLLNESLRNTTATIFNAQGIKLRTVLLQHDVEHVNIKSLPAGTYYLVTVKGSGRFVVVR